MPKGFSPAVREAFQQNREAAIGLVREKMHELLPNMGESQRAWAEKHAADYQDLFQSYLNAGSIDAVRPRMRELTRLTTKTGMSLDAFVRIIFDAMSSSKAMLVRLMPCSPEDLVSTFALMDAYDYAIFDEFSQAQREYWERREREATRLHEDFFNHIPFPAIAGTPDLVIREVNPALTSVIPVHPEQIVGLTLEQWLMRMSIPPRVVRTLVNKFNAEGAVVHEEVEIRGATRESSLWLMLSLNFIIDSEGNRIGFQAMLEDMTEKRRLQRRLADQKAQMDAVFDSTPAGLTYVDSSRIIRRINASACNLLGYPPPEVVENSDMKTFRESVKGNYKDPEEYVKLLEEVYGNSEASRRGTVETLKPPRTLRYSVTPVYEPDGDAIGWLWIFNDITEQMATEKLKNDLTHMIVHDLKNPLTAIRGGAMLLKGTLPADDERSTQAVDLVQRNCDRMVGMIMNLLDIERLESGKLNLERSQFSLREFLQAGLDNQRLAAGTRELKLDLAPELNGVVISADANLMERVIGNLLSNAIKHTRPNGHICVRASAPSEERLAISVIDDGAGIAKQYHEKIFLKFGQAELRREGHKTDTGLGLTFCKLAIEAHGGTIGVESEPGKGSNFTVYLPSTETHFGTLPRDLQAAKF
jgi:PAS domain S-box-containing protein